MAAVAITVATQVSADGEHVSRILPRVGAESQQPQRVRRD